jgi:hypothetical protein
MRENWWISLLIAGFTSFLFPYQTDARSLKWQPGIYTNEEQVYFEKEAGRTPPEWLSVRAAIADDGIQFSPLDSYGKPSNRTKELTVKLSENGQAVSFDEIRFRNGGQSYTLRRARPASCWVAIRKENPKVSGKEDWHFASDVKLHDQGGRARAGGAETGAQPLIIRMRNVVWPANKDGTPSKNRPSLVLYVHKAEDPDHAESYVWADPGATRIGINLRWMQASCTIDGLEIPKK